MLSSLNSWINVCVLFKTNAEILTENWYFSGKLGSLLICLLIAKIKSLYYESYENKDWLFIFDAVKVLIWRWWLCAEWIDILWLIFQYLKLKHVTIDSRGFSYVLYSGSFCFANGQTVLFVSLARNFHRIHSLVWVVFNFCDHLSHITLLS